MSEAILEVEHLKKSYIPGKRILDDINFSIQKGEVVVVIGPSGCGKSTFLRCLNRLEDIDEGELKLNGVNYEKESRKIHEVREKIGMVFQSYDLFPNMNILDNLILAPCMVQKREKEEVKKEAELLLERVGLLEKKKDYPRQLSGGQKQRVAIVRALLMHPEDLKSKDLIVVKGTTAETYFTENYPEVNLIKFDEYQEAYDATLKAVYGDGVDPENLVVEGGVIQ